MQGKSVLFWKSSIQIALLSALSVMLFACNSGRSNLDVADIEQLPVSTAKLVPANQSNLSLTIQNGLLLNTGVIYRDDGCHTCEFMSVTAESADAGGDQAAASDNFSSTTTQEQGVGESDRVKYDGSSLFLASNASNRYYWWNQDDGESEPVHVRVLQRQDDDSLSEVAKIYANESAGELSDLYLNDGNLAMLYNIYEYQEQQQTDGTQDIAIDWYWHPYTNYIGLDLYDVTQAQSPNKRGQFKIDGHLMSSRRIDNQVHLVSQYTPELPENIEVPEGLSEIELQQFYNQLVQTSIDDLLPKIYFEDGESTALVTAEQCLIPENLQANYGYATVTTITTFDMENPSQFHSKCILAPLNGLYSSVSALYLHEAVYNGEQDQNKTVIHKFEYQQQGVSYKASGNVLGYTGWNNPHLRFSEKDGQLRVVTSERQWTENGREFEHRLFVLNETSDGELEILAQLPNANQPAKIGKPDEDIYAVRYYSDKAYVVTFRRTDPLYVINLSNPSAPFIQGELEIPGYSGYLQPLNDEFVLGIGQQVDPNNGGGLIPVGSEGNPFEEGAKAELYNVSDPNDPQVAATLVYENRYSVAEYDYHALTQLQVADNSYRFAFPLGGWTVTENEDGTSNWNYYQSMQLIEVEAQGQGTLNNVANLTADSEYYGQWGDRAVLHGDIVYYIRNNQVWQSYWSTPNVINGPY